MSEVPAERGFAGTDFFTLAKDLAKREDEAAQRSAVRNCRSLLRERKDADYRLNAGDWPRRAEHAIESGERALRALLSLLD